MNDNPDYYIDEFGNLVMTEAFHLRRGSCCGNGCRHCPFEYVAVKDNRLRTRLIRNKNKKS